MAKLVNLKKSAAERKSEKDARGEAIYDPSEEEGFTVHLDHHHLQKMGVGGALKSGDKVALHGEGTVESSESRSSKDGDRHSARLRIHKAGIDHDADDIREDVKASMAGAEKRATEKTALNAARKGKE